MGNLRTCLSKIIFNIQVKQYSLSKGLGKNVSLFRVFSCTARSLCKIFTKKLRSIKTLEYTIIRLSTQLYIYRNKNLVNSITAGIIQNFLVKSIKSVNNINCTKSKSLAGFSSTCLVEHRNPPPTLLVAKLLYNSECPSICPSVRPSVRN